MRTNPAGRNIIFFFQYFFVFLLSQYNVPRLVVPGGSTYRGECLGSMGQYGATTELRAYTECLVLVSSSLETHLPSALVLCKLLPVYYYAFQGGTRVPGFV